MEDRSVGRTPHALEQYLLNTYHLDGERLHRLALFLLAHAIVDFHLTPPSRQTSGKSAVGQRSSRSTSSRRSPTRQRKVPSEGTWRRQAGVSS